jgi:anti-sigma factor ChrR (cupin superfamily)
MSDSLSDDVEFDDLITLAIAQAADPGAPRPEVKQRLMARLGEAAGPVPAGFSFRFAKDDDWLPHPLPGIRMKVLSLDRDRCCATVIFDVAPGTRFPAHRHTGGAEECYVISGSLFTWGQRLGAGDFVHANAETDHSELWTDEGCRVLLVVPPEDYFPAPPQWLAHGVNSG